MTDICKDCLAQNIIAPHHGPTCTHSVPNGVRWWPDGWERMLESERMTWLKAKADK